MEETLFPYYTQSIAEIRGGRGVEATRLVKIEGADEVLCDCDGVVGLKDTVRPTSRNKQVSPGNCTSTQSSIEFSTLLRKDRRRFSRVASPQNLEGYRKEGIPRLGRC